MAIQSLRFSASHSAKEPTQVHLSLESSQSFTQLKEQGLPAVYVVRTDDLARISKFEAQVLNRGEKDPRKGLAEYLLGHDRIPLLSGRYSSCGQFVRSVRALLENARKRTTKRRKEENAYIIGVANAIFEALWERSGASDTPPEQGVSTLHDTFLSDRDTEASDLLRLLEEDEDAKVDEILEEAYVGQSLQARLVRALIVRAARTEDKVLILGDTGTGKEVVARQIHRISGCSGGIFVPVNCAGIPSDMLESDLFGHKRGAFSNAYYNKEGLWQTANHGTLFLDEIEELTRAHQAKILRVLEDGFFRRVGDVAEIRSDARVIAATNRDLYAMVQAGTFREDLYYRLRGFLIRTPSLEECPEDFPLLVNHLWKRITRDDQAVLPQEVVTSLRSYRWPGNVRGLRSALANLFHFFGKERLEIRRLTRVMMQETPRSSVPKGPAVKTRIRMHQVECLQHLRRADEIIRACKIALRSLARPKQTPPAPAETTRTALRARLEELEILCLHPLLFHGEETFSAVAHLKGKLTHLYGLLKEDSHEARRYWNGELSDGFKQAWDMLFREVERLESKG